jgi:hypothetical protein
MGDKGNANANANALVVMSNKDTYYVDTRTAQAIQQQLKEDNTSGFVWFIDTRTHAGVTLNLGQISSVVVRSDSDGIKQ